MTPQPWLILCVILLTHTLTSGKTYRQVVRFDVYNDSTGGHLIDLQHRSFLFDKGGTVSAQVTCDSPTAPSWGSNPPFNMFLCEESPVTRWLYLYPIWGMCFREEHQYHHCSVDTFQLTSPTTWVYNKTIGAQQYTVARLRTCPIYAPISLPDRNYKKSALFASYIVMRYRCQMVVVFLNKDSRLSSDETWNPFIYYILVALYGGLVLKALFEIWAYSKLYKVKCAYFVYALIFTKFLLVSATLAYYYKILNAEDLQDGYKDYEFVMAVVQAAKFTIYYLTLIMLGSGYGIYNTKSVFSSSFHSSVGALLYTTFLYVFILQDSYIEVPFVVMVSAAFAAILALFWSYHFKRLLMVRYEFNALPDRDRHTIAKQQIRGKELLVGVAFFEIISFLAYVIVFEFYHAENYPVPGTSGVVVTETAELLLILPLACFFNLRDLSRYYPAPAPPPIIHVIKTPNNGYQVSMTSSDVTLPREMSVIDEELTLIRLAHDRQVEQYFSSSEEEEEEREGVENGGDREYEVYEMGTE